MSIKTSNALRLASLLLALSWSGAAQAQPTTGVPWDYLLTGNSGGELQIGTGLPLPIGPAGIFLGGMNSGTAGVFPPLLVPPNPRVSTGGPGTVQIAQDNATPQGGAIQIPPRVLKIAAPGAPVPLALFTTNPALFQVATTIAYGWPGHRNAYLAPGGAPGPNVLGTPIAGGIISYSGGAKSFGGPGRFQIQAGPGAAGGRVPPNLAGVLPVASVWINAFAGLPVTATMVALAGASAVDTLPGRNTGMGLAQAGARPASVAGTTMFGGVASGIGLINFGVTTTGAGTAMGTPNGTMGFLCTVFCGTPKGGLPSGSFVVAAPFPSNMVTGSKGFPWTTGFITVSQPGALPVEVFYMSGTDARVNGVGNLSLVSGALSVRQLSGPNANRGWLSLNFAATP